MRSIRLKLDKKYCKKCNTVDSLTSQTPATWRANATEIEVGAFENDIPLDLTGYTGLELVIRPDRTTSTNLAYKAIAVPDSVTITANGWTAGTDQHVTFSLTDSELNLDLDGGERQTYWLAVTASDASGNETTLGTSWFIVEEDNNATAAAPEENPGTGITEDIADARYIAKAEIDAKGDIITGSANDTPITLTAGADGQVLTASSAQPEGLLWTTVSGTGDMQAATYDPTPVGGDVFDMDNMVEGANTKILTAAERAEIAANTTASHAAVTVSDSAEIDLTLTGQDISASIIAGSIDETKLDASTNTSLGLADTSVQPNDDAATLGSGAAADGLVLKADGIGGAAWETDAGGSGGVTGPVTSTDNALARYDGTSGGFVQDSAASVDDTGNITANNLSGTNTGDQDLSAYQLEPSEGAFANGDKTKLDGIEASADVTDSVNVVSSLDSAILTDAGTPVATDQVLIKDASTGALQTADFSDFGGGGASQLDELSDVVSATNTNEFVLVANGTTGYVGRALLEGDISDLQAYITDITGDPLGNLSDVTVTAIGSNEILKWNGSAWINQTLAEAGIQPAPAEGAFIDGDKTKLDGIEASADVTDTTNVTAAGALMDSEVDANLKTFTLPASTTVSAFGAGLVDDADAAAARTTLESSGVTSGAGAPVSTPSVVGDIYIDTTNDNSYIAIDTLSSADWKNTATAAGGDVASDLIWDSVGDIAAANGNNSAVKRTVGTNGQVLTADSTDVSGTGLAWTTPDDWEVASTGTIDISNLPFQNAGEQLTVNEAGSALEFGLASKYIPVRSSGSAIAVGTPVYLTGYNIPGDIITVDIADSSNAAKMPALGLAFEQIETSGSHRVLIAGSMTDLDTSGYSFGDSLYIGSAIGSDIPWLTNIRPTGSSKVQAIAKVSRSSGSFGSIVVQGAGRSNDIPNQMVDNAFTIIGSADATKQFDFDVDTNVTTATTRTISIPDKNGTMALTNDLNYDIAIACSDETTDLTGSTTVPLATFHAQRAGTWDEVWAGVTTAPVGGTPAMFIDVHKNGTTIFTTRPSIDSTEKSSHSANAGFVLAGTPTFIKGDLIEVFCDQIGSTTAGAGLKVYFNISE